MAFSFNLYIYIGEEGLNRSGHSRCFIIYQAVLLKFDSIVVAVMLEYVLGYIRPLSILLSCD